MTTGTIIITFQTQQEGDINDNKALEIALKRKFLSLKSSMFDLLFFLAKKYFFIANLKSMSQPHPHKKKNQHT